MNSFIVHQQLVGNFPGFIKVHKLSIIKTVLMPVIHGVRLLDEITHAFFNNDDLNGSVLGNFFCSKRNDSSQIEEFVIRAALGGWYPVCRINELRFLLLILR